MQPKKRGLGKGLAALLPTDMPPPPPLGGGGATPVPPVVREPDPVAPGDRVRRLSIDKVAPNPLQPRGIFHEESLEELAASIREKGIISPIVATPRGDQLMIVAGERRYRAARLAGLGEVPVLTLDLTDQEVMEYALIENLQREDLNAMEEARAYRALMDTFGLSQEQVADKVGKGRPTIANALRLLRLPEEMQQDIEVGRMSPGHARAILSLDSEADRTRLRDSILRHGISVREAEELAARLANRETRSRPRRSGSGGDGAADAPEVVSLRNALLEHFACRVEVKTVDPNRGRIEIHFDSLDELDRILDILGVEAK